LTGSDPASNASNKQGSDPALHGSDPIEAKEQKNARHSGIHLAGIYFLKSLDVGLRRYDENARVLIFLSSFNLSSFYLPFLTESPLFRIMWS